MASFKVQGLGELIIDMEAFAKIPGDVLDEMLYAGAEPVVKAQEAQYREDGLVDKGNLAPSPAPAVHTGLKQEGRSLDVYPQGINHKVTAASDSAGTTKKRHTRKKGGSYDVSNAEVGFINEFGTKDRPATQTIRKATEKSADEAVRKEEEVYNNWLDSIGL